MGFQYIKKIPSAADIISEMPLEISLKRVKEERDHGIKAVLEGTSPKFLIIIGPCSADNENSVCEYIGRLRLLQDKVSDKIILIPRIYTNKPRTTGDGYKGMAHQPVLDEDPDIVEGIRAIRRMHIRAFSETHLTAADEMLYPGNYPYLEDLLSYVAIGARSVENQEHRLTVSGIDIAVGMKNPTSGDISVMLNSIQAAQHPHVFIYNGWQVNTSGNPLAHAIQRGAINQYGQAIPNYHYEDMMRLIDTYEKRALKNPAVIIDTNHANSNKKFNEQPRIALEVVDSMRKSGPIRKMVKGLMIESYLVEGAQDMSAKVYGKSITDPCLGWEASEKLVLELADRL